MRRLRISARHRAAALTTAICVAVAVSVVVGVTHRPAAGKRDLRAGTAWLVSNRVGELALVDGVSAEVSDRVKVARPGSRLGSTQPGADAYAINRSDGEMVRVDGASHRVSAPAHLLHSVSRDIQTFV